MNQPRAIDSTAELLFPRPILWLSTVVTTVGAAFLIAGGLSLWSDPTTSIAMKVVAPAAGVAFLGTAIMTSVVGLYRPRKSATDILSDSEGCEGLRISGSRRTLGALGIGISTWLLGTISGAWFANTGLRIALLVLAAVLTVALGALVAMAKRPRFLHLRLTHIESAAHANHARVEWGEISSVGLATSGGGQVVLRLAVHDMSRSYEESWRNRFEFRRKAIDIEYMLLGVDGNALERLVIDLMAIPQSRPMLETHKDLVAQALASPSDTWHTQWRDSISW